jgi:hypothetical protein
MKQQHHMDDPDRMKQPPHMDDPDRMKQPPHQDEPASRMPDAHEGKHTPNALAQAYARFGIDPRLVARAESVSRLSLRALCRLSEPVRPTSSSHRRDAGAPGQRQPFWRQHRLRL